MPQGERINGIYKQPKMSERTPSAHAQQIKEGIHTTINEIAGIRDELKGMIDSIHALFTCKNLAPHRRAIDKWLKQHHKTLIAQMHSSVPSIERERSCITEKLSYLTEKVNGLSDYYDSINAIAPGEEYRSAAWDPPTKMISERIEFTNHACREVERYIEHSRMNSVVSRVRAYLEKLYELIRVPYPKFSISLAENVASAPESRTMVSSRSVLANIAATCEKLLEKDIPFCEDIFRRFYGIYTTITRTADGATTTLAIEEKVRSTFFNQIEAVRDDFLTKIGRFVPMVASLSADSLNGIDFAQEGTYSISTPAECSSNGDFGNNCFFSKKAIIGGPSRSYEYDEEHNHGSGAPDGHGAWCVTFIYIPEECRDSYPRALDCYAQACTSGAYGNLLPSTCHVHRVSASLMVAATLHEMADDPYVSASAFMAVSIERQCKIHARIHRHHRRCVVDVTAAARGLEHIEAIEKTFPTIGHLLEKEALFVSQCMRYAETGMFSLAPGVCSNAKHHFHRNLMTGARPRSELLDLIAKRDSPAIRIQSRRRSTPAGYMQKSIQYALEDGHDAIILGVTPDEMLSIHMGACPLLIPQDTPYANYAGLLSIEECQAMGEFAACTPIARRACIIVARSESMCNPWAHHPMSVYSCSNCVHDCSDILEADPMAPHFYRTSIASAATFAIAMAAHGKRSILGKLTPDYGRFLISTDESSDVYSHQIRAPKQQHHDFFMALNVHGADLALAHSSNPIVRLEELASEFDSIVTAAVAYSIESLCLNVNKINCGSDCWKQPLLAIEKALVQAYVAGMLTESVIMGVMRMALPNSIVNSYEYHERSEADPNSILEERIAMRHGLHCACLAAPLRISSTNWKPVVELERFLSSEQRTAVRERFENMSLVIANNVIPGMPRASSQSYEEVRRQVLDVLNRYYAMIDITDLPIQPSQEKQISALFSHAVQRRLLIVPPRTPNFISVRLPFEDTGTSTGLGVARCVLDNLIEALNWLVEQKRAENFYNGIDLTHGYYIAVVSLIHIARIIKVQRPLSKNVLRLPRRKAYMSGLAIAVEQEFFQQKWMVDAVSNNTDLELKRTFENIFTKFSSHGPDTEMLSLDEVRCACAIMFGDFANGSYWESVFFGDPLCDQSSIPRINISLYASALSDKTERDKIIRFNNGDSIPKVMQICNDIVSAATEEMGMHQFYKYVTGTCMDSGTNKCVVYMIDYQKDIRKRHLPVVSTCEKQIIIMNYWSTAASQANPGVSPKDLFQSDLAAVVKNGVKIFSNI